MSSLVSESRQSLLAVMAVEPADIRGKKNKAVKPQNLDYLEYKAQHSV